MASPHSACALEGRASDLVGSRTRLSKVTVRKVAVFFAVHPPVRQRRLAGAEQHRVPKPDGPVNALVRIVAGQQLMLVQPAADALSPNAILQRAGNRLVLMVVPALFHHHHRCWGGDPSQWLTPYFRINSTAKSKFWLSSSATRSAGVCQVISRKRISSALMATVSIPLA